MKQSKEAMQLKSKIKNYAKPRNIPSQVVLQNLMFEHFLARLSKSEYNDKFVIKGGILVSSMVGLETRSTMDLDTTLQNMPLSENEIMQAVTEICKIDLNDNVAFSNFLFEPIRKDDIYGGFRLKFIASYFTMQTPLSIDISTGDVITPKPVRFNFSRIFDEENSFQLLAYNLETVLAEKSEAILSRGITGTRPRDFYDIHILTKTQTFDRELFFQALKATSEHRGTQKILAGIDKQLEEIKASTELMALWKKYQEKFSYAKNISYEMLMQSLSNLLI